MLQADEADLLAECVDDYVGFWKVLWNITDAHPGASPGEVRERVLEVVRRLLFKGLITAGGFEHGGDDFRARGCGPDQAMTRIERVWDALGRDPDFGEVTWFTSTAKGDAVWQALHAPDGSTLSRKPE